MIAARLVVAVALALGVGGLGTATAAPETTAPKTTATATAAPATPVDPAPIGLPPTGAGVDISYPQCDADPRNQLMPNVPFAIVGVNGGRPGNTNPCFEAQYNSALLLAGPTEQPHASVYINTANPSLGASWWPTGDSTQAGTAVVNPDGSCRHKAGPACAYVYGYSMAEFDYTTVDETLEKLPELWWLDVETTNSWQYDDTAADAAVLTGMVDYLEGRQQTVGIYSTSYQWGRIAGATSESGSLAGLRSWLAGGSAIGAPADCELGALTPHGWVSMIQFVTHLDNDYSCRRFRETSSIEPAGASEVGTSLTAVTGRWALGAVAYTYQWDRDGAVIHGATGSRYTTTPADVGAAISVTITGAAPGYSTRAKGSAAAAVLGRITARAVQLHGKAVAGQTLTAVTGAWKPRRETLTYSWYRGGALVSSGVDVTKYVLSSVDVGQRITLMVSGEDEGFAPTTQTAISSVVTR